MSGLRRLLYINLLGNPLQLSSSVAFAHIDGYKMQHYLKIDINVSYTVGELGKNYLEWCARMINLYYTHKRLPVDFCECENTRCCSRWGSLDYSSELITNLLVLFFWGGGVGVSLLGLIKTTGRRVYIPCVVTLFARRCAARYGPW